MPVIEESVVIERSVADVFRYMSDGTKLTVYDASVVLCRQVGDGETVVGTRWHGVTKVLGRDFGWTSECVVLEPDRRITVRSIEGKLQFEITMAFRPTDVGTRLEYRLDVASGLGGVFGRLTDSLVVGVQTRTLKGNLGTVKALLDSHSE